ncbi:zinc-dependent metalloprotease [Seonamhaeicola maritimus]|uniref:DUF5117 domain-containing protein n=1 Tax=Seonamhaeicola maritimus TaxID=2591822 RepID=A0A5C7GMK7_9FLAO|nr:zinc-dependent metalloprotease [Seonamhaeicola maritimus]TXG39573.1 DUF5117 domain-containing protein [Seonamhaeicola maritimus]
MKYFILMWFLLIYYSGFTINPDNDLYSNKSISEVLEKQSFLTSFIEEDQLYLNIPNQLIGKSILFVRYDQSQEFKYMQVVWARLNDKILLKIPRIQSSAGNIIPLNDNPSLRENIMAVFPINKEYSNSMGYCVNITNLVLNQGIEWTPGFSETLKPKLSFLEQVKNLHNEVIIRTKRGLVINQSKVVIPVHFSFCALPELMKPRKFDYRMGFFNEEKNSISHGMKNTKANIIRWRIEKRNKNKKISVPIKPITFILSPEIPEKWRPYVKAGIESWLPAFESAGFKDALVVKEVDSLNYWQTYSVNSSIVHWGDYRNVRGFEDAGGGTVLDIIDLRSGEILKADIHLGATLQKLADMYFLRCAPLDKRAHKYPFPDDLMGELIKSLTAHEAGHAFGIMDNNFGEYSYPFEMMNDRNWLKKMGHTPSIMTYARHNNIAQPKDSIPASLLIQKVGPTDVYYIKWAYTSFPNTVSINAELVELERIIRMQDSIPWYRYNNGNYEVVGPGCTNEVVDNDDPIKSAEMALKNLKRVIALIPKVNYGQTDNARVERLYKKTLELWYHHMRHVLSLVGGYDIHYKAISQGGSIYTPINWEQQEAAIGFLVKNAFNPPYWLVNPEFGYKINYSVYPDKILDYQQRILFELLRPQRMKRLEQMEKINGFEGATGRFLQVLQLGLFDELNQDLEVVEARKQEIQNTFIDKMVWVIKQRREHVNADDKINDYTDYSRGLILEQLIFLKESLEEKLKMEIRKKTIGHWKLCLMTLNEAKKK